MNKINKEGLIIDQFMDYDLLKSDEIDFFHDNTEIYCYNTSWDCLMPVIKKCIDLGIYSSDWTNELHDGLLNCNIQQCYEAVIEFISKK